MDDTIQDIVAKQMKDELLHVARDVNGIICSDLECKNCPFWISGECMLDKLKTIIVECLNNG